MVFDEAVTGLVSTPPLVHLNGSAYAAAMRHGVLTFLLSQLDDGQLATRHELVHGLANLLCGDGGRAIVTLGSPELIDAESATILAQLAAMRKIWLVPVSERLADLPEDILALYRAGRLSRVTVHCMDVTETRTFLESELGGSISMFATAVLWHLTQSNRDVLRGLVRELVADGKLVLESGCWVMAPGSLRVGPTLTSFGARMMAGLGIDERHLLSALALGGSVTAEELRQSGLSNDLGPLRARGLVSVGEAPAGIVSITAPLLGHLLRNTADDDLREELGATLNRLYPAPRSARLLTEVRAMRDLGNLEALVALVDEFAAEGGFSPDAWRADANRQAAIVKVVVETLCIMGSPEQASRRLSQATAGLAAALRLNPEEARLVRAAQLMRVKSARIAVVEGRPAAVRTLFEEPGQRHPGQPQNPERGASIQGVPAQAADGTVWASEALYFKALAVQAEAWSMTSRHPESLDIVRRLLVDIGGLQVTGVLDQIMSATECAEIECTLLRVQLLSGEWRAAADTATRLAAGHYPDIRSIAYGEFVLGLLRGFAGEADAALGALLPTLKQLAITGESAELSAVEAASAYCLADHDRGPEAIDLLLQNPSSTDRELPLNFFSWSAEVFASLAVSRLDTPKAATSRLVALADRARRGERTVLEMNSLAMAMRLGRTDVAARLQTVCESSPVPRTRGFLLLAQGTVEADPVMMADGLEQLASHGQTVYADEDGNVLVAALGHRDRRRVFAAVAQARRRGANESESAGTTARNAEPRPAWLDQLTKREAQVAQRVISGMTNTAIARMSGVSVRTVEGHLYQVYSKLQVRNRQELTALDRASRRAVEVK
ncbi:helix-turn-helix transcriptional regulator [Micrococcaceae bacterium RIT802]|nr:helix-turn-helix transcriptional regulator [Micrococcaceae bacterium RIT 802]